MVGGSCIPFGNASLQQIAQLVGEVEQNTVHVLHRRRLGTSLDCSNPPLYPCVVALDGLRVGAVNLGASLIGAKDTRNAGRRRCGITSKELVIVAGEAVVCHCSVLLSCHHEAVSVNTNTGINEGILYVDAV